MKSYGQLNKKDEAFGILLLACLVFWVLAKIPTVAGLQLFTIIYEMMALPMVAATIICPIYFLYKWFKNKLKLNIYFYGLFIGLAALAIMWFIY